MVVQIYLPVCPCKDWRKFTHFFLLIWWVNVILLREVNHNKVIMTKSFKFLLVLLPSVLSSTNIRIYSFTDIHIFIDSRSWYDWSHSVDLYRLLSFMVVFKLYILLKEKFYNLWKCILLFVSENYHLFRASSKNSIF